MKADLEQERDRRGLAASAILIAAGLLFFGAYAARAGLHLDDHGFCRSFAHAGWAQLWSDTVHYVPGRNLYIPLFFALYKVCGGSAAAMHLCGLFLDLLNPLLVMALARRIGASRGAALAAAGLFLVWPNHGETHWWTSSIMMNLFTTTLALGAFLAAGRTSLPRAPRLALAALLYVVALFDYDQVFLLWIPLLAFARWADPGLKPRPLAAAAGGFLFLNAAHFAARMLSPFSSGGRPVPRTDVILLSMKHALTQTLAPVRRWPVLADFPGGLPAALLLAAAAAAVWVFFCARHWNDEGRERAAVRLTLLGGAWWFFAYAPNFLWYISPRHNYLPSVGTALLAAALAVRLSLSGRARPILASAGAAFFALGGLCAWSDGSAWAKSTALHERFLSDVLPDLPAGADEIYLFGAPKELRTAPAFFQPQEHLYILSRRTGVSPGGGDNSAAVNRLGLFSGGQIDLFGADAPPRFTDLRFAALFTLRGDGRFERVCGLRLSMPGLAPRELVLGGGDCPGRLGQEVPVAMVESRSMPSRARAPEVPTPVSASLSEGPGGTFDLTLTWRAGKSPAADFAAYPALLGASGRTLFSSVYAASPREHKILWPLFNDVLPPSRWRVGQTIVERYRLRRPKPWDEPPTRLRLTLFERRERAVWKALPAQEIAVAAP
ncbi:MAG: hypothetical protein WCU88_03415 [Elusimicrobiota bacterium]|jgi:hypothetical protein